MLDQQRKVVFGSIMRGNSKLVILLESDDESDDDKRRLHGKSFDQLLFNSRYQSDKFKKQFI